MITGSSVWQDACETAIYNNAMKCKYLFILFYIVIFHCAIDNTGVNTIATIPVISADR